MQCRIAVISWDLQSAHTLHWIFEVKWIKWKRKKKLFVIFICCVLFLLFHSTIYSLLFEILIKCSDVLLIKLFQIFIISWSFNKFLFSPCLYIIAGIFIPKARNYIYLKSNFKFHTFCMRLLYPKHVIMKSYNSCVSHWKYFVWFDAFSHQNITK